jgi:hypothetical protein
MVFLNRLNFLKNRDLHSPSLFKSYWLKIIVEFMSAYRIRKHFNIIEYILPDSFTILVCFPLDKLTFQELEEALTYHIVKTASLSGHAADKAV